MKELRFEFDNRTNAADMHDDLEILYVLSGHVDVVIEGQSVLLRQDDYLVINPYEFAEVHQRPGSHILSAFISGEAIRLSGIGDVRCCSAVQTEQADYHALVRNRLAVIFNDYLKSEDDRRLYIMSGTINLLAILKQQFEISSLNDEKGSISHERVRKCIQYVGSHYMDDLTLDSVARSNFISSGHLSRKFKQVTGQHFSDYLRGVRLSRVAYYLRFSDDSVTDISEMCGFSNVNTMISNFKDRYGVTPGAYRKSHAVNERSEDNISNIDAVYFVNLLNHAHDIDQISVLTRPEKEPVDVVADIRKSIGSLDLQHNYSMTFGYAKTWFSPGIPESIERSVKDIGFNYVFTQGIFDDGMSVYHENVNGEAVCDFTYLDIVLDHIISLGTFPWLELGRTPGKLLYETRESFFGGFVQLPDHMDGWNTLVKAFAKHVVDRYGIDHVRQWRFSVFPPLYIHYGVFTLERYLEYYRATWSALKDILPDAKIISGAFDVGLMHLEGNREFRAFLEFCKEKNCLPDELGFQSFSIDYSSAAKEDIEIRIRRDISNVYEEPATPNSDPDILRHDIELINNALNEEDLGTLPFCFVYWNSTIWDNDLGNDTCYKSAYITKNVLENAGRTTALNYSHSLFDQGRLCDNVFAGRHGAVTVGGVPKAAYYAMEMLSRMGDALIAMGEGYTITKSEDDQIQILLYNYCHYDPDTHLDRFLPREEQLTIDRYFGFRDHGAAGINIHLIGLEQAEYIRETWSINRIQGSSYDIWRRIGSPKELTDSQIRYLENASQPGYRYEILSRTDNGELLIPAVLDAHEVQLIILKKAM